MDEWSSTSPSVFQPLLKSSPSHPAAPKSSDYELVPLVAHLHLRPNVSLKIGVRFIRPLLLSLAFTCLAACREVGSRRRNISCNTSSMLCANRSLNRAIVCSVGSSKAVKGGRRMGKLFTKDPQPRAVPRTARPLLDGPLDRLRLDRNGALTSFHFDIDFYATKASTTDGVMNPFRI